MMVTVECNWDEPVILRVYELLTAVVRFAPVESLAVVVELTVTAVGKIR